VSIEKSYLSDSQATYSWH